MRAQTQQQVDDIHASLQPSFTRFCDVNVLPCGAAALSATDEPRLMWRFFHYELYGAIYSQEVHFRRYRQHQPHEDRDARPLTETQEMQGWWNTLRYPLYVDTASPRPSSAKAVWHSMKICPTIDGCSVFFKAFSVRRTDEIMRICTLASRNVNLCTIDCQAVISAADYGIHPGSLNGNSLSILPSVCSAALGCPTATLRQFFQG